MDGWNDSGESVSETSALGLSAFYRGVSIIASTIAGLPLKSYRDKDGTREEVSSVWDDPGAGVFTRYEFMHTCMVHLCIHGNCFLLHVFNDGGALTGFFPVHPSMVTVKFVDGQREFHVSWGDRPAEVFTEREMTQVMLFSTDGLTGSSPISLARNAIGTGIAGDRAAAKMFKSGLLMGGIVTPDEDMSLEDGQAIKAGLDAKIAGVTGAGSLAFINKSLKISPWQMNSEDAQFLESRMFQVEEVARILGIPPHLLMQTDKQTSWGTGVEEQNNGLARYTLKAYTSPFEARASFITRGSTFVEFDYAGLLQGTPAEEIRLLLEQTAAGFLTINEARAIRNLPPLPGGDALPATGATEQGQAPADSSTEEM
jgi:HK97 family phage portal protein